MMLGSNHETIIPTSLSSSESREDDYFDRNVRSFSNEIYITNVERIIQMLESRFRFFFLVCFNLLYLFTIKINMQEEISGPLS